MRIYTLKKEQFLTIGINEAWDFFSNPANLQKITPPDMGFKILSELPGNIYPGLIINYTVNAFYGFSVNWVTEITQAVEKRYFIDEQRFGPYKFWHHQHHFKEVNGGTITTDIVNYGLPFGIIGNFAHDLIVKGRLKEIFEYRKRVLIELFPA